MKKINKVSMSENLLVGAGKSSRLTAISNTVVTKNNSSVVNYLNKQDPLDNRLKPEIKVALELAVNLIDEKVLVILSGYPPAKKYSLFKLRFGVDIDKINTMTIEQIFSLLYLDASRIRNFRLIENLDLKGVLVIDYDQ